MVKGNGPYFNSEGYPDPTSFQAILNIQMEELATQNKVNFIIKIIKFILHESGFELLNRVEIKDKKTGKCYK